MISRTLRGRINRAEWDTSTTTFQRTCYWLGEWQSIARALTAELEAAPPSAPVGDSLVQTALRNLPQYISKSGLVGPDKHAAMQCFETLRDALAQQPAACPKCDGTGEADSGGIMPWGAPATIPCDCRQPAAVDEAAIRYALDHARDLDDGVARVVAALAQQPAVVDGVMRKVAAVAHSGGLIDMSPNDALTAIRRLSLPYWGKEEKPEQVHATLAAQPGGSDND